MRKIFTIAWKDTLIRFSSPIELLFFIVLPIIFTFLLSGGTGSQGDPRIRLVVVDQANTPLSAQLLTELQNSTSVRPDVTNLSDADSQFQDRTADAVLVIPATFDEQHLENRDVQLELKEQPNDLNAQVAQNAVQAATQRLGSVVSSALDAVQQADQIKPFDSTQARQTFFEQSLAEAETLMKTAPNRLEVIHGDTPETVDYDPAANSSAGQLITWVFIPLLGISSLFAYERTQGTLRRLLTTPTSRATFLLGTISGQVLTAIVQMLLLVGFGIWVLHTNWGHDPAALAVILVATALAGAAMGTTMGTFIKTEGQANGLSILLGMLMALMGGCWYPLELFPAFIQNAVHILPTTWAMQGMLDLVLRGQGLSAVLPEAGVLLIFAAVFFAIGVWRFRYE